MSEATEQNNKQPKYNEAEPTCSFNSHRYLIKKEQNVEMPQMQF